MNRSVLTRSTFVGVLFMVLLGCNPTPQPYTCDVVTPKLDPKFKVLSSYEASYFSTECPSSTPKEVLVAENGYSVYMYLRAGGGSKVYIGIEGDSSKFSFKKEDWQENNKDSPIPRATHWKNLSDLRSDFTKSLLSNNQDGVGILINPDIKKIGEPREIKFTVSDRAGRAINHGYPFTITKCTCKAYDAL